jgi:hypothetical protein
MSFTPFVLVVCELINTKLKTELYRRAENEGTYKYVVLKFSVSKSFPIPVSAGTRCQVATISYQFITLSETFSFEDLFHRLKEAIH